MKMEGTEGKVCYFYNYHEPSKTCELNFGSLKQSLENQASKGYWETYILKTSSSDPKPYYGYGNKVRSLAIKNKFWTKALFLRHST